MAGSGRGGEDERRRAFRLPLKIAVDYSAVDAFFSEFCANINEGGMFVETESPPEPETLVQLQIRLPGLDEPLPVAGRVAWVSEGKEGAPPGMGIEFIGLDPEARRTINAVVRRLRSAS
jgi:uncharacterized protein (TIGR02266 family)